MTSRMAECLLYNRDKQIYFSLDATLSSFRAAELSRLEHARRELKTRRDFAFYG